MRVLGLVEHLDHVCCRYRLAAFRDYLEAEGHELELQAIPDGLWARFKLWRSLGKADVAVIQRRLLSSWHLLMLRRYARRLIFDFDDAIFQRSSFSTKTSESSVRLRRFTATLHAADRIVTGNEFLREHVGRFVDASRVHVIPTCVQPAAYPLARHDRVQAGVQLVWIGSSSTVRGLEREADLLDTIADHVPGVQCKIICDRFPTFKRMPAIPAPWTQQTEARELAGADIGISCLPDDRWSRGKCGLKVLQYMAAGLPVVANPVGVQAAIVQDGETGFLARTPAEWIHAIRLLAANPDLRQRMGQAGRQLVEREYSVSRGAESWLQLLESLLPAKRRERASQRKPRIRATITFAASRLRQAL